MADVRERELVREYAKAVAHHWVQAVIGPVVTVAAIVATNVLGIAVPNLVWLVVLLALVSWGQYLAWKDLRAERGSLRSPPLSGGGMTPTEHREQLRAALEAIDEELKDQGLPPVRHFLDDPNLERLRIAMADGLALVPLLPEPGSFEFSPRVYQLFMEWRERARIALEPWPGRQRVFMTDRFPAEHHHAFNGGRFRMDVERLIAVVTATYEAESGR